VQGADALFQRMAELLFADEHRVPAFFSTHPLDEERIYAIQDRAERNRWRTQGELTQFPEAIRIQFPAMASGEGQDDSLSADGEDEGVHDVEELAPAQDSESLDGAQ
jgi:predicted Zn-dependent protease